MASAAQHCPRVLDVSLLSGPRNFSNRLVNCGNGRDFHNSLTKESKRLRGQTEEFLKNLWNAFPREAGVS